MKARFLVTLEMPAGVSIPTMEDYIDNAVSCYIEIANFGGALNDLDSATVRVKHQRPAKKKRKVKR